MGAGAVVTGYGDGSGDGYGSYGNGYGDGSGDGYGSYGSYGDGNGCSGDGYGSGEGADVMAYWLTVAKALAPPDRAFEGGQLAFWRSDAAGRPINGGQSIAPARVGIVETVTPPVHICKHGLHATLNPPKWQGSRWWLVWLTGEIQQQEDKFAALSREILCEVTPKWEAASK